MGETSHPGAIHDPSAGVPPDNNTEFWHDMFSRNGGCTPCRSGSSRLDSEWGYVFEKSSKTKTMRRKNTNVSCSSVVNSASDLSEALSESLSAISAALSLSTSSHTSDGKSEEEEDNVDRDPSALSFLKNVGNSLENHSTFEIQSLSTERNAEEVQAKSNLDDKERTEREVPELGMMFPSEEEAYRFYQDYAHKVGFRVRKGKVRWLSDGTIRKRFFFCSKQGFRSKKQSEKITKYKRKETRTGCDARIQFTVEDGTWVVSHIFNNHNHLLEDLSHQHEISAANLTSEMENKFEWAMKEMEDNSNVRNTGDFGKKGAAQTRYRSPQSIRNGSEVDLLILMDRKESHRKRMIPNKELARSSRMRKQKALEDLESQMQLQRKENGELTTSLGIITNHYLRVEAENSVLRAHIGELKERFKSLKEIAAFLNTKDDTIGDSSQLGASWTHGLSGQITPFIY